MKREPLLFEDSYNAPIEKVWQALTDKDEMKKWYFDLAEFKPEVGFEFEFTAGPDEGPQFRHLCKVTEVIPGKRLTYSWRYDGYPGDSFVTFDLSENGEKTKLKLTHIGTETFGDDPAFSASNFTQGWTHFVHTALKNFVE